MFILMLNLILQNVRAEEIIYKKMPLPVKDQLELRQNTLLIEYLKTNPDLFKKYLGNDGRSFQLEKSEEEKQLDLALKENMEMQITIDHLIKELDEVMANSNNLYQDQYIKIAISDGFEKEGTPLDLKLKTTTKTTSR